MVGLLCLSLVLVCWICCCVGDLAGLNVLNLRLKCWFDCLGVLLFMLVLVVVVLLGVAFGCVGWFCGLYCLLGGLLLLGLVGGCLVAFVLWLFVLVLLVR